MKELPRYRPVSAAMAAALAWICAFTLSCNLYATHLEKETITDYGGRSLIGTLLSEARFAVSGEFYAMADTYFHRGVEHIEKKALEDRFFSKLKEKISPRAHVHARGMGVKEIMPWLRLATITDPHNVEAYLVASFWLRTKVNRPDLALDILKEAQWNNPMNARVQFAKARAYISRKQLSDALSTLSAGLAFLETKKTETGKQDKYLRSQLLSYRALLYEIKEQNSKAIKDYEEILDLFPKRKKLLDRIEALRSGKENQTRAYKLLNMLIKEDARPSPEMMFHGKNKAQTHTHNSK